MLRNSFRGRVRAGGRVKIRQRGSFGTRNRASLSIPRGVRTNIRVRQG